MSSRCCLSAALDAFLHHLAHHGLAEHLLQERDRAPCPCETPSSGNRRGPPRASRCSWLPAPPRSPRRPYSRLSPSDFVAVTCIPSSPFPDTVSGYPFCCPVHRRPAFGGVPSRRPGGNRLLHRPVPIARPLRRRRIPGKSRLRQWCGAEGLEPPRLAAREPKSRVSTSSHHARLSRASGTHAVARTFGAVRLLSGPIEAGTYSSVLLRRDRKKSVPHARRERSSRGASRSEVEPTEHRRERVGQILRNQPRSRDLSRRIATWSHDRKVPAAACAACPARHQPRDQPAPGHLPSPRSPAMPPRRTCPGPHGSAAAPSGAAITVVGPLEEHHGPRPLRRLRARPIDHGTVPGPAIGDTVELGGEIGEQPGETRRDGASARNRARQPFQRAGIRRLTRRLVSASASSTVGRPSHARTPATAAARPGQRSRDRRHAPDRSGTRSPAGPRRARP